MLTLCLTVFLKELLRIKNTATAWVYKGWEQCGNGKSGLRGKRHAAQGEINISASTFCVANALIFLAAVYTEGGQNWQMPVISRARHRNLGWSF